MSAAVPPPRIPAGVIATASGGGDWRTLSLTEYAAREALDEASARAEVGAGIAIDRASNIAAQRETLSQWETLTESEYQARSAADSASWRPIYPLTGWGLSHCYQCRQRLPRPAIRCTCCVFPPGHNRRRTSRQPVEPGEFPVEPGYWTDVGSASE